MREDSWKFLYEIRFEVGQEAEVIDRGSPYFRQKGVVREELQQAPRGYYSYRLEFPDGEERYFWEEHLK